MKKKVNVFGKKLPVFMIVLLGIAVVSAALVPYLSGLVIGTVNVQSPLVLTVGEAAESWVVGSDDAFNLITKDVVLVNNADTPITAIIETNITGVDFSVGEGKFGEEFKMFWVGVDLSSAIVDGVTQDDLNAFCMDDSGVFFDITDNYCYWSALNPVTGSTFSGVKDGVFYVQIGDRDVPTPIPAGATMNARMKLQFKINVAPATYVFETQALTQSDSTDLDGLK